VGEMIHGILGRKLGMTQVFAADGNMVAVTAIEAGPCYVTQVRTRDKDGYEAVQLGFGSAKKLNSPEKGHLKGVPAGRHLREFDVDDIGEAEVGQKIDAALFQPGEMVDVIGVSKGKGFAGVMKRHNFKGGPKTHGQSDRPRSPGSIGATTTPGRVWKGKKMGGRLGGDRVTIQNLEVVRVDPARNLLLVAGGVPGAREGLLMIRKSRTLA
jgi:large subunit ribosomal protein L3